MKALMRSIGIAAGMALLAGVPQAHAQVVGPITFITAFPFAVGNATVPAGSYTITPDEDNTEILLLRGANVGVMFQTSPAQARQASAKTEIVFMRYGDEYVLKDVFVQGSTTGAESARVEAETHVAKRGNTNTEYRVIALIVESSKDR